MGCASMQPGEPPALAMQQTEATLLGEDDVFEMHVYGEEALSGTYRVGSAGSVSVPLVGNINLLNLTPEQASDKLAQEFGKYLRNPHVSVFVKEFNSKKIYVFGEVRRPGTFAYSGGMNIIQAITLAGGFERLADKNGAFVTRLVNQNEQRLRVSIKDIGEGRANNFQLAPGDIVYIPEAMF